MNDKEGFIQMLGGPRPAKPVEVEPESPPVPAVSAAQLLNITEDDRWTDDPVSVKWDKIRRVFLNAKDPVELHVDAAAMSTTQWLEMALRMAPKDVRVTAEFSFRALAEEFGPIDKELYKPSRIIEAEFTEIK